MTNTTIPEDVINVISLGQKYSYSNNFDKNTTTQLIKNIEQLLDITQFNTEIKNDIRKIITTNIKSHNKKIKHISYEERLFAQRLRITKSFLRENKNIFFTFADKGNITVAIDSLTYKDKMTLMLSDTNTYKKVKRNPLATLQKNVKDIMMKWNDLGYLDKKYHKNNLTQTDTMLPRMYGLPKIHKNNIPMRPIVSCIGSPTYKLSKVIESILNNSLTKPKSYIKNSLNLIEIVKNIEIPNDHIMLSLDVTSLFTNIPLELLIKGVVKRYPTIMQKYNIPLDDIIGIIKFLMDNTFFQFDNEFYQQTYGSPMGSPVSPIFADIVMTDLEEECINKLSFKPIIYKRYVDDTLICIPANELHEVIKLFNSYHPRLQFTHEVEVDGKINFLEVSLIRKGNKIITDWYRKHTFSGRFLHFKSSHPIEQKRAMIFTLVDKATCLADKIFHNKNINIIKEFLVNNEYPLKFVNYNIKKRLQKIKFSEPSNSLSKDYNNCNFNISIPYIPKFFNEVKKNLKTYSIRSIPQIYNTLDKIIIRGKDKTDKKTSTNVVYKINCNECNASYVGETKRQLKCRIQEHVANLKKDGQYVINQHMTEHKHTFDFNGTEILDTEKVWRKRLISEMVHIKLQENPINIKEDTQKLSQYYDNLLYNLKTRKK